MTDDDLIYLRPSTAEEAVSAWIDSAGRSPGTKDIRYLGGGTEIVTSARRVAQSPRVLIDVARIGELRLCQAGERIVFGAALSLNEVGDSGLFPLMTATVRRIADRTTRNRLTLGGNIAGSLPYREAVLPLLLADALLLTLAPGAEGASPVRRERPLRQAFDKRLHLEPGELVVGFSLASPAAATPWYHDRATRTGPVDYPLVTACFLAGAGAAVSGLFPHPAWFSTVDEALAAPGARSDQRGSAEYRVALLAAMARRAEEKL